MKTLKILFTSIQMIFFHTVCSGQLQYYKVEGHIQNEQTGVFVSKPEIYVPDINKSLESNKEGFFQIMLPSGTHILIISHKEYLEKGFPLQIHSDTTVTIKLTPQLRSYYIDDVTVTANPLNKVSDPHTGLERINPTTINLVPVIGGERDILKTLQHLPGVNTGAEGSSEIMVRGGSSAQNLYLLDEATIYNPKHLLGFISTYNPMTLGSVDFYKGGFPSRYGGRLSSIIDANSKAPNHNKLQGECSVGTISSKAYIQIPVIPESSSLFLSARRTYFDLLIYPFQDKNLRESLNFHDLYAKYSHSITNGSLQFSIYHDRDKQYSLFAPRSNQLIKDDLSITKQNLLAGLTWNQKYQRWNTIFSASYIKYGLTLADKKERPDSIETLTKEFKSGITDLKLSNRATYPFTKRSQLQLGMEYIYHGFNPASFKHTDYALDTLIERITPCYQHELSLHSEITHRLEQGHTISLGIRATDYLQNGNSDYSIEPRLLFSYQVHKRIALKTSYTRMSQSAHLLCNPGLGQPLDIWISSYEQIPYEFSNQYTLGLYSQLFASSNSLFASVEGYYKTLHRVVEYRDGYSSSSLTSLQGGAFNDITEIITTGEGISYGIEHLVEKKSGKLKGWISYTLSWTSYRFPELNHGKPFAPRYDSRHNLSIIGSYTLNTKWAVGWSWKYYTGQAITLPEQTYVLYLPSQINGQIPEMPEEYPLYIQGERNTHRMKDYHTLNIDVKRTLLFKRTTALLEFGVYNAYNRHNPYYYKYSISYKGSDSDHQGLYDAELKAVSVFPLIPFISFSWKF